MPNRVIVLLLLVTSAFALTVNLDGLRMDLDPPEGFTAYPSETGYILLLSLGEEGTPGVIHLYPAEEIGYTAEEIITFYEGDSNTFLADLLADLRRAITDSNRGFALRWGGYNKTSAKQVYLASADYFDTFEDRGYYNLDSLLMLEGRFIFVDAYCGAEDAGALRETVLAVLSSISGREGW